MRRADTDGERTWRTTPVCSTWRVLRAVQLRLSELYIDHDAAPERRIVITDDFGQRIQMSHDQLRDLVADVKSGVLDGVCRGPRLTGLAGRSRRRGHGVGRPEPAFRRARTTLPPLWRTNRRSRRSSLKS